MPYHYLKGQREIYFGFHTHNSNHHWMAISHTSYFNDDDEGNDDYENADDDTNLKDLTMFPHITWNQKTKNCYPL